MGNRLLLLTRRFPYNCGEVAAESYLETEIGALSDNFDRVFVVATEASISDEPSCALPENVEAVALGCTPTMAHKVALTARGALYAVSAPDEVHEAFMADPVDTAKHHVFRGYFVARAYEKYTRIMPELEDYSFNPTAIYSFWLYDTALTALWIRGVYPCARAVARAHRYDLYQDHTCVGYLPFRELLLSELDAVLPCSENGRAYLEANWPGHTERLHTSYLGTTELPDLSDAPRTEIFHIVSCSRVVSVKRVDFIADALAMLDAEGRCICWTHYGDGPELSRVRQRCAGFSSVVVGFPGLVPNVELLQIYREQRIDLFINVSESEGLPISIMEACGVGAPVLATDVGGVGEIVKNGMNGVLLPPNSHPNEISQAIARFMDMPEKDVLRMRRASRCMWEGHFRTAENVCQLVSLLKESDVA